MLKYGEMRLQMGEIRQKTQNKFQQMSETIKNGEDELEADLYAKAQENVDTYYSLVFHISF